MNEIEVDRSAIVSVYKQQNLDALNAAVTRGEWTEAEAARAHALFMESDVLQTLVSRDAEMVKAMLSAEVH